MKKIIFIALSLSLLTSCTLWNKSAETPVENTASETKKEIAAGANSMVSLNYTLRTDSPSGKVVDTSVESVAKENGLYNSGAPYKPFEFVIGSNQVVPGFEAGVMGMKKGEKKLIEVAPKDGYGEATIERTVNKYEIAPLFTITTDKRNFSDKNTETLPLSTFGEEAKDITVGKTLTGGAGITAKVIKLDGENVTLEIDNKNNPFYGKKLVVGAKAEKEKAKFTVKAVTETGVTLEVENGESPFYGKEFIAGASATLENGGTLTVKSLSGETVTLITPNTHPLAGKTLYFAVEVTDIK